MTTTAEMDLKVNQLDVFLAYINGDLEETIYMDQPDGCTEKKDYLCHLKKSLYGLKQSGRNWFLKLHQELLNFRLKQLNSDCCEYI